MTKEEKKKLASKCAKYGWQILEAKFLYYQGGKHNIKSFLSDDDYDLLEKKYQKICKKLKWKPSATDLVGFPDNPKSGCHKMIAQHMIATKGRKTRHKEIIKEINVSLKVFKKILKKALNEKKFKEIYKKVKAELDPNK